VRGTPRRFPNATYSARPLSREVTPTLPEEQFDELAGDDDEEEHEEFHTPVDDPAPDTPEEREKFYQEVRLTVEWVSKSTSTHCTVGQSP
jgi:hypothetical protein